MVKQVMRPRCFVRYGKQNNFTSFRKVFDSNKAFQNPTRSSKWVTMWYGRSDTLCFWLKNVKMTFICRNIKIATFYCGTWNTHYSLYVDVVCYYLLINLHTVGSINIWRQTHIKLNEVYKVHIQLWTKSFLSLWCFSSSTFNICGLLFEQSVISRYFCVAFRKSCKDFYIMKSDGLYIKCHETMILLRAIYFCTKRFYAVPLK